MTIEPMCSSTPSLIRLVRALADSLGPKDASGAPPPSNSSTRASSGLATRYSARSVLVASSRIWPASSTPVGPAPTRANVSQRRRSAGIFGSLGHLERAEHPAADGQHVGDRLHARSEPGELVMPEIRLPHPGGDDQVVVPEFELAAPGPDGDHAAAIGIDAGHLGHDALDVLVPLEHAAQRGGDLPLGQDAGRALVEQRLEQVVVRRGRSGSPTRRGRARGR